MKNVTLYLIRHGETYLNKYGKMQGWADAPLTDRGIADARATGERLADRVFDAVYASDLGRTQATARIICAENEHAAQLKIIPRSEWRESSFGALDGSFCSYVYGQVAEREGVEPGDLFKQLSLAQMASAIKAIDPAHAAEDDEEFRTRLKRALSDTLEGVSDGAHVMVVTHGNVIRTLVSMIDPTIEVRRELKNSGVTTIAFAGDTGRVLGFNE